MNKTPLTPEEEMFESIDDSIDFAANHEKCEQCNGFGKKVCTICKTQPNCIEKQLRKTCTHPDCQVCKGKGHIPKSQ